jgi:hypothetical protein
MIIDSKKIIFDEDLLETNLRVNDQVIDKIKRTVFTVEFIDLENAKAGSTGKYKHTMDLRDTYHFGIVV